MVAQQPHVGAVLRSGRVAEVGADLGPRVDATDGAPADHPGDRGRVVERAAARQRLVAPAVRGRRDQVQVDLATAFVGHGDGGRPPVAQDAPVAGRGQRGEHRVDRWQRHDQVDVRVRPGGLADQRVDAPAAVDPGLDAGGGQQVEDGEHVAGVHYSAGRHPECGHVRVAGRHGRDVTGDNSSRWGRWCGSVERPPRASRRSPGALARRYGLRLYGADTTTWAHRDRALARGIPAAHAFETLSPLGALGAPDGRAGRHVAAPGTRPMVVDDLAGLPDHPLVVAEGTTLPARAVDPARSVWLLPTPEFQRARLDARPAPTGPHCCGNRTRQ